MYYILSDKEIQEAGGRFTRQQAYNQWNSLRYNEEEKAMLLQLLLKDKFDICYELPHEKDVFISPLLLPSDQPSLWGYETNLHFRYQYSFIPHGLFSRLIVQLHEKIDAEQRWKTGVRLLARMYGDFIRAEIQQFTDPNENQKVIDIRINGSREGCKQMLTFVRTAVDKLHKDFKNISCKEKVACNCEKCSDLVKIGEKPSFFDYKKLQDKIQNRSYFEECEKSNYKQINIGKILSDIVIENAAYGNIDNDFLYNLLRKGMTINQIINKNEVNISDIGKASSSATASSEANLTNTISIEINNLLCETEMLKEDIKRELKIKKFPTEDIELVKSDIEVAENAIKEIKVSKNQNQEPSPQSKKRLKGFIDDLSNENSTLNKALKLLRKGKDYGVNLAETYNKVAENIGLPLVPPIALEVIKKL